MGVCQDAHVCSAFWAVAVISRGLQKLPVDKDAVMLLFSSHEGWSLVAASVLELKLESSGCTPSFMPCVPPSCFFNVKRIFVCCSEDIILLRL